MTGGSTVQIWSQPQIYLDITNNMEKYFGHIRERHLSSLQNTVLAAGQNRIDLDLVTYCPETFLLILFHSPVKKMIY